MKALTGIEWLKKHISKLEIKNSKFKEQINKIVKIKPNIYNKFQAWTPLKLVLLNYALDTCTTIIRNKPFFKEMYYVDLFSGSGLNKINQTDNMLIGSPFIASLNFSKNYDKMFFYEKNLAFSEALAYRFKKLNLSNIQIKRGSCNDYLDELMKIVNKPNTYSFLFVDPYNTEFDWSCMKKILSINASGINGRDIIFTFMSSNIIRSVGLFKKGGSTGEDLSCFFGNDDWKIAQSIDELIEIYVRNILRERPKTIVKNIKIQSKKHGFCYHLLFITNKTKKENPWLRSIEKAKKEIEKNSDKSVEMAINIIQKKQSQLSNFFN